MKKDANKTRNRILQAAVDEFSRFGIAGARVDRIALTARCNKQMIYAYFGNKDRLFDTVYEAVSEKVLQSIEFEATNLPGYVERICALFEEHPEVIRLAVWRRLEGDGRDEPAALSATLRDRIESIRAAQEAGRVSGRFAPEELLALLGSLVLTGALSPAPLRNSAVAERVRPQVIVDAVRLLVRPE